MSKKINIDFDIIDTKNPYFLSIIDHSFWGNIKSNTSYIEITKPGYSKPIVKYFDKNSVNTYNSFHLELSCIDECSDKCYEAIPDGIYCITVRSTCEKYYNSKKFLKTTLLELELDKYILSKINCRDFIDKTGQDKITEIEFILKAAKAHLRYDNISDAQDLFTKACEKLNKLKTNC